MKCLNFQGQTYINQIHLKKLCKTYTYWSLNKITFVIVLLMSPVSLLTTIQILRKPNSQQLRGNETEVYDKEERYQTQVNNEKFYVAIFISLFLSVSVSVCVSISLSLSL